MDSQRLILFFVFSFSLFLLFDAWQRDQQPVAPGPAKKAQQQPGEQQPSPPPVVTVDKVAPVQGAKPPEGRAAAGRGETIKVETDLVRAEISTLGGELRGLEFKHHRDTADKNKAFVLFQRQADHTYVAQSGMIGEYVAEPGTAGKAQVPNHHTLYTAAASQYQLAEGSDTLEVRLDAAGPAAGVKIYRFRRGSYLIDVEHQVTNSGPQTLRAHGYFQLVRDGKAPAGESAMLPTFLTAAVYTDKEKFQKFAFPDIEKGKIAYPKSSTDGWIALLQHYFLTAWLAKNGMPREFYIKHLEGGLYAAGVIVPVGTVAPGAKASVTVPLYAGPQEQDKLAKLAPGLDLTVDYGWLTVIAVPLFWVLAWMYGWTGNWGIAIIVLTVLIKLLFYPLSEASYRSMARMRVLAPKLQRLKEQYGEDRQRLQQAMMELYKTEKINPLGGCLPIVVQIPVFIALYWVLLASVELRHAPFGLGIDDLSGAAIISFSPLSLASFPYFILPLLMAATMIIQTKLNPEPPDPVQAKVMKIMPIAFSIFFFWFPAGLVLYWLVNNVLSIVQQWHINRVLERASAKNPAKS
jgi:YidC/Oxa1 family membrane protein insertase